MKEGTVPVPPPTAPALIAMMKYYLGAIAFVGATSVRG